MKGSDTPVVPGGPRPPPRPNRRRPQAGGRPTSSPITALLRAQSHIRHCCDFPRSRSAPEGGARERSVVTPATALALGRGLATVGTGAGWAYDGSMSRPPSEPRPRRSDRPRTGGQGSTGAPEQNWRWAVVVLLGPRVAVLLLPPLFSHTPRKQLTYTDLIGKVDASQVRSAVVDNSNGHITGELADGTKYRVSGPQPPIADDLKSMRAHKVDLTFHSPQSNIFGSLLAYAFPILLVIVFFVWMNRRAQGQMSGIMSIGRSKAKVYTTERPRTTFNDVAGYNGVKQEIREVVEFLRSPQRFKEIGARIPKGVLLVGPPGTGKTLLARAVAGEAGVPFMSVTGSDFMEMFVGVGASRVRDLFQTARKQAPAILFVAGI